MTGCRLSAWGVRERIPWRATLAALLLLHAAAPASASEGETDLGLMSIEDLLDVEVTSVSRRAQKVADAEGEASRFEQLLAEYRKAPSVTRERLYIEAIEDVYGSSNKVLLDASGSGNLLYLPIDKLVNPDGARTIRQSSVPGMTAPSQRDSSDIRQSSNEARDRRTRQ